MTTAKNLKQHKPKVNQFYIDKIEDEWGDEKYIINGVTYNTLKEARKAISEFINKEFTSRLNKSFKGK